MLDRPGAATPDYMPAVSSTPAVPAVSSMPAVSIHARVAVIMPSVEMVNNTGVVTDNEEANTNMAINTSVICRAIFDTSISSTVQNELWMVWSPYTRACCRHYAGLFPRLSPRLPSARMRSEGYSTWSVRLCVGLSVYLYILELQATKRHENGTLVFSATSALKNNVADLAKTAEFWQEKPAPPWTTFRDTTHQLARCAFITRLGACSTGSVSRARLSTLRLARESTPGAALQRCCKCYFKCC